MSEPETRPGGPKTRRRAGSESARVRDPARRPRKPNQKETLPRTLTRDEAARLLAAPNLKAPTGLRNRCILDLMYRAGLRVGEVLALTPRDLDIETGTIRIYTGKTGDGTSYLERDEYVRSLLREWRRVRRGLPKSPYLFCTLDGGQVSVRYVEYMIKRMAKRAGIEIRVHPHMLRHTFATELLEEGKNIRQVQRALRHKNLATTERYTHVLDPDLREAIQTRKR